MSDTLIPPASPYNPTQVWLPWPPASFDYLVSDDTGEVITTDGGEPITF